MTLLGKQKQRNFISAQGLANWANYYQGQGERVQSRQREILSIKEDEIPHSRNL